MYYHMSKYVSIFSCHWPRQRIMDYVYTYCIVYNFLDYTGAKIVFLFDFVDSFANRISSTKRNKVVV